MLHIFHPTQTSNSFEGQLPDEKTLIVLRAHWFTIANRFAILFILAIVPFVIYGLAQQPIDNSGVAPLFWLIVSVYLMFLWLRLFYQIFLYILNVWIVTDHRIIESEQHGFFNRSVSELNVASVQDVTVIINGFYATTLGFGDIEVETAAKEEKFLFKSVPNPTLAKDLIMKVHNDFLQLHADGMEPQL